MAMHVIPSDRQVFKLIIPVTVQDIDELNHVNNVVYLQWVQDVASAHWNYAASEELKSKCMWVVLRHEIDYHSPALPGDTLEALTWIEKAQGPQQKRMVSIRRTSDQKVLVSACTSWCLLDPQTVRPKRISEEITSVLWLKD